MKTLDKDRSPTGAMLNIIDSSGTVSFNGIQHGKTIALDSIPKTVISMNSGQTIISKQQSPRTIRKCNNIP